MKAHLITGMWRGRGGAGASVAAAAGLAGLRVPITESRARAPDHRVAAQNTHLAKDELAA